MSRRISTSAARGAIRPIGDFCATLIAKRNSAFSLSCRWPHLPLRPPLSPKPAPSAKRSRNFFQLNIMGARTDWVQETYPTDDTEAINAAQNDRIIARTTGW